MEENKEILALDYEECINYIASKVECDKEIINKIMKLSGLCSRALLNTLIL